MDKQPRILKMTSNFLDRFCKSDLIEGILGDLEESYFENRERRGAWKAGAFHLIQVAGFLRAQDSRKSQNTQT